MNAVAGPELLSVSLSTVSCACDTEVKVGIASEDFLPVFFLAAGVGGLIAGSWILSFFSVWGGVISAFGSSFFVAGWATVLGVNFFF